MGSMRIVYVLTSLGMGGAEKQALAVADRMEKRGHIVALLVLRPRVPEEWATAVETAYLGMCKTPLSLLTGLVRAHRFLRDFRPDLVHSHSFHANIFARLLGLRMPPLVVVSTVHNVYEGAWPRMLAYRLTDSLSRRTVAVSQAAADRFVRLKAIAERRCLVLTNGIDTAEFMPNTERRASSTSAMGIGQAAAHQGFAWLAAGRISPAKDYPNLLRAFAKARARRSDTVLWIAGACVSDELAQLKELSAQLDLGDSVRWLGLRRDMPALLDAADGFVSASAWEGMPLAVGEAMAMQKPVVATDVGGVRELVGDSGVLVPARDCEALAEAIRSTMQRSEEEREQTGRAARERILRHFSVDAAANAWEALYRELLA
jgi:glycosyltransferase involved in cell wall biosynthesis